MPKRIPKGSSAPSQETEDSGKQQIAIRMEKSLVREIDNEVLRLSNNEMKGMSVCRSDIIRAFVIEGLERKKQALALKKE